MNTELRKSFYIDGDKTKSFEELAKVTKPLYETGKLRIMRVTKPIPPERRKPDVPGFKVWDDPKDESFYEVYWDNVCVTGKCAFPKDVHCVVLGLGFGLRILRGAL